MKSFFIPLLLTFLFLSDLSLYLSSMHLQIWSYHLCYHVSVQNETKKNSLVFSSTEPLFSSFISSPVQHPPFARRENSSEHLHVYVQRAEFADMCVMLCAVVVLLAFPLGNMFVLRPAAKAQRFREEVEIRKILLESLNLQQEPRVSVSEMKHLREQWKDAVSSTAVNSTFPEESGNTTQQKCCKHSSQIFIKDLGWDGWIVHPETFTFTRCKSCCLNPCSENTSSPTQCCKPTTHETLPFVYVDDWSSLVVSSVSVARECGCDPGEDTQEPEVMTPS